MKLFSFSLTVMSFTQIPQFRVAMVREKIPVKMTCLLVREKPGNSEVVQGNLERTGKSQRI